MVQCSYSCYTTGCRVARVVIPVCKSCVVKFLQSNKHCPQCSLKIHETQPLLSLKADRVMQDIVFKLVPQLYNGEHVVFKLVPQLYNDEHVVFKLVPQLEQ